MFALTVALDDVGESRGRLPRPAFVFALLDGLQGNPQRPARPRPEGPQPAALAHLVNRLPGDVQAAGGLGHG